MAQRQILPINLIIPGKHYFEVKREDVVESLRDELRDCNLQGKLVSFNTAETPCYKVLDETYFKFVVVNCTYHLVENKPKTKKRKE
jgi:hypothetical protein